MECEYCHKIFKNKHTLGTHQKIAKYCLKIQGVKEKVGDFMCDFCGTSFLRKAVLNNHTKVCKANTPYIQTRLEMIPKLEQEVAILKKQLEESLRREQDYRSDLMNLAVLLVKKPTNTTNTVNHLNFSDNKKVLDSIKNSIEREGGIWE